MFVIIFMFNNYLMNGLLFTNLLIYSISISTLYVFLCSRFKFYAVLQNKDLLLVGLLLLFISGMPIGFVFLTKTQLWFFSQNIRLVLLIITLLLSNTVFLYFYLGFFKRLYNKKPKQPLTQGLTVKNTTNYIIINTILSLLLFQIFLVFNYSFFVL